MLLNILFILCSYGYSEQDYTHAHIQKINSHTSIDIKLIMLINNINLIVYYFQENYMFHDNNSLI